MNLLLLLFPEMITKLLKIYISIDFQSISAIELYCVGNVSMCNIIVLFLPQMEEGHDRGRQKTVMLDLNMCGDLIPRTPVGLFRNKTELDAHRQ